MTPRQRLASIILQLNYGYTSWREALRLARGAALGRAGDDARAAAEAVRASLDAADAALKTIETREAVLAR